MSSSSSASRQQVPSTGWYVEIDGANGHTHTPDILDDPQRIPKTNDFPEITIPVRRSDKWLAPEFEEAALRVWCDGNRQPIDQLEKVEVQSGTTVLRGRGAIELKEPVEATFTEAAIHEAAKELIEEHTTYTANVDEPDVDVEEDVLVADVTSTEDFINEFEFRETDPISTSGGSLYPYQTCYSYDAVDDNNVTSFTDVVSNDYYSGDQALHFDSKPDQVFFRVNFNYRVPAEHVGIKIRDRILGQSDISFQWNGTEFERLDQGDTGEGLGWVEVGSESHYTTRQGYQTVIGDDILPNQNYWFKIVAEDVSDYRLDSIAVYDTRYNYTWDNFAPAGEYLSGPENYPHRLWVSSRELPQTRAVIGGTLDAEFNSTITLDDLFVDARFSHTQGRFYQSPNPNHPDPGLVNREPGFFATPGGSLKVGFYLSRWGDNPERQQIPTRGFERHAVQNYRLEADLSTLPIIVNRSYNDSLRDILRDLANRGNFIWEYRRDPKTGEQSIEWTQIGQRETTVDADAIDYTIEKDSSQIVEQTAVYGSNQNYIARIQAKVGAAVGLPNNRLQELSETVRDPRSGQRYERNEDYEVDYENGTITAQDDGLMEHNAWYEVEYEYQTYAEYTLPGASNPRRLPPQDIAGLASNTACAQAARTLINDLQTPQFEAQVTIPRETVPWGLADALNIEGLETNGQALKQRNVEHEPGQTNLTLGIGRDVGEIIQEIETRVSSISRNS